MNDLPNPQDPNNPQNTNPPAPPQPSQEPQFFQPPSYVAQNVNQQIAAERGQQPYAPTPAEPQGGVFARMWRTIKGLPPILMVAGVLGVLLLVGGIVAALSLRQQGESANSTLTGKNQDINIRPRENGARAVIGEEGVRVVQPEEAVPAPAAGDTNGDGQEDAVEDENNDLLAYDWDDVDYWDDEETYASDDESEERAYEDERNYDPGTDPYEENDGGSGADEPSDTPGAPAEPPKPSGPSAKDDDPYDDSINSVLAISIDGLNSEALRRLGATGAPNLHYMMKNGVSTLNARTEHELTITLPNHTGMLTGLRVSGRNGHGVTFNEDNKKTLRQSAGRYVPGIFDILHDRGRTTAMYAMKDKFYFLERSWNGQNGQRDTIGSDNGRDKLDVFERNDTNGLISNLVKNLSGSKPKTFQFLHIGYPDFTGHDKGWFSPAYMDAVKESDRQVGRVLQTIRNDKKLRGSVAVILTSDHGGKGTSHSDVNLKDNYTVPFVVWAPGVPAVKKGSDLYARNKSTRVNPGVARTTYAGKQPIRNGEVANLALDLLDIVAIPDSEFNSDQDLEIR